MAQAASVRMTASELDVLKMLSQGAPMLEVLNELCNSLSAKLPRAVPAILLLDRGGVQLRLAAGPKVPEAWNEAFSGLKVRSSASVPGANGAGHNEPAIVDLSSDRSFEACWRLISSRGVQSGWSMPIQAKDGKRLGDLLVFCPSLRSPDKEDFELMRQGVQIASIAIERHRCEEELREFSRQLYRSQDTERRRIARELHDSTGQKLAVLQMNLSIVKDTVKAQPPEFDAMFSQCISLTKSISDELRTLSYLLHPPMLDECGLNTAILWYVSGINQREGLHVDVEVAKEVCRLSEDAELAIFRIVQASLTNVHLHSGASQAKVKIDQDMDGVVVAVTDDGHGIAAGVLDRSSQTKTVGVGITGMRERVEQLGGRLEIETGHNGTTVKATVPCSNFRTAATAPSVPAQCSLPPQRAPLPFRKNKAREISAFETSM
jgi:signal transduction histidine kinase